MTRAGAAAQANEAGKITVASPSTLAADDSN